MRLRLILALGLGLVLPLAFAPFHAAWLVPLVLAALFLCWHRQPPRHAAWLGYAFGLGFFGVGVSWVQISIHQFGLPLYSFSVSMTALFVAFMALYPALAGWLAARLPARSEAWRLGALMPAVWLLVEWTRGWLFSGFPWLVLGDSQTDGPCRGFLPLLGAQGTSLVLALSGGGLAIALVRRSQRPLPWLVLAVVPVMLGPLLARIEWTAPDGPPQGIAIVQGAVPQAEKWSPEYRAGTLDRYATLTEPLWGAAAIVWPETALPAFPQEIPEFIAAIEARARTSGTALLLGLPTSGDAQRYYNSLVVLGDHEARYSKHHLVPFGEYLPFDAQLRPLLDFLSIPMSSFSAGEERQSTLDVGTLRFGATICYEDAYASEVTKTLPRANVLVNVSNDAWFGDSAAPHQHLQIARVRALEAGRPLVRATNTGISALIDHDGRVLERTRQFEPATLTGTITPRRGITPFIRTGPWPALATSILLLLAGCRRLGSKFVPAA